MASDVDSRRMTTDLSIVRSEVARDFRTVVDRLASLETKIERLRVDIGARLDALEARVDRLERDA